MTAGWITPVTQMGWSKVPQYNTGTFLSVIASAHLEYTRFNRLLLQFPYFFIACFSNMKHTILRTKKTPHPHAHKKPVMRNPFNQSCVSGDIKNTSSERNGTQNSIMLQRENHSGKVKRKFTNPITILEREPSYTRLKKLRLSASRQSLSVTAG